MKKKTLAKLRSQSGESIGETLVALLISALALVMLAGAVSSASSAITRSNEAMARYYAGDNALAERAEGGSNITVTIQDKDDVALTQTTADGAYQYFTNDTFPATHVVAYGRAAVEEEP